MSSGRLWEVVNEAQLAPWRLRKLLLAYSYSGIGDFRGGDRFGAGVKTVRADGPGRVREGLLVSNILSILSKSRLYTLRPQGGWRISGSSGVAYSLIV